MGGVGASRGVGCGGGCPLNALVVPDVPSVQVDRGFWYSVPDGLEPAVGSVVRVPLGGRVVRGWVTRVDDSPRAGLKALRRISGDHTVFSPQLLETLQWAAHHYVAPVSSLLKKTSPPNLPRRATAKALPEVPAEIDGVYTPLGVSAVEGAGGPPVVVVGNVSSEAVASAAGPVLRSGHSTMAVFPTGVEAQRFFDEVAGLGARTVLVHPEMSDRQVTDRWSRVRDQSGYLLVGTERIALWPVAGLRLAWIVGDGRRGLKARQTPTLHVRELLRSRAAGERFSLVLSSVVPSTEALAGGARLVVQPGRLWPRTEVIDRGEDPPGGGVLGTRARAAISAAARQGKTAFVFTHRHGYAPAFRCVSCRTLRVCEVCEARAVGKTQCARCGSPLGPCRKCAGRAFEPMGAGEGRVLSELTKFVTPALVGPVGSDGPVWVGTERDLPLVASRHVAVAVDADGLIFGTNYRAPETALRLLARVAGTVATSAGARFIVQTARPSHPIIQALQRGEPIGLLEAMIEERRQERLPPVGQLLVLDITDPPSWLPERLAELSGDLLGPIEYGDRRRWLLQGASLDRDKRTLRGIVQDARDAGARVRVDADPIDL